jgi:two-component system, NtrC family, response regulator HydG
MKTVLIVDDKEMMRDSVGTTLERAGFKVVVVADGEAALHAVAQARPDAVVTDMRMPGMTGLELLEKLRAIDDELPVVVMTAFGTIETAVKAMRVGAFDYLTKPFEGDELIITVKRAVEHRRMVRENAVLRVTAGPDAPVASGKAKAIGDASAEKRGLERLVGSSSVMKTLREQIKAVAASGGTVLITGESGVGKEVVARAVHETSPRGNNTFLAVNCAALSSSLLESELFGHERGAFTGAEKTRKGRFELADQGTLLLDEVSEVSPALQAKLLRVLQERNFERVGSSLSIGVDVRTIATSNRDLQQSSERGEFRLDLYYRINVLPVVVPPLRQRLEDVPELVQHFIGTICGREGRPLPKIEHEAIVLMQDYSWPGNVRELENICERAVVLSNLQADSARHGTITRELIEPWLTGQPRPTMGMAPTMELKPVLNGHSNGFGNGHVHGMASSTLKQLEDIEREAIVTALVHFKGHRQKTAHALGIGVRTLGLKLKKWKETGLVSESL